MWDSIASVVSKAAPLLGNLIPIPGVGVAISLVAAALGVEETPDAVQKAINTDPEWAAKLKMTEDNNRTSLESQLIQAETNRIQSVNETMQVESKSEHWAQWGWRPFWGFISGIAFLVLIVFVCILAYQAIAKGNPAGLTMVPQLIGAFAALFATPLAILGVASHHRGRQKRHAAGEGADPSVIANLISKLKK